MIQQHALVLMFAASERFIAEDTEKNYADNAESPDERFLGNWWIILKALSAFCI